MKLLLTGAFNYSDIQIDKIKNLGYEITFIQEERKEISLDVSEFEVVVCNNLFIYNDISRFKKLKVIQLTSAGFDRVPMNYIKENDIHIFNAKDVYSVPMAEWAILKILEIYKSSSFFYNNQREHRWEKRRDLLELTDKKVGIIGFGNVGLEIAKRLRAFNTENIAINRSTVKSEYIDQYIPINQLKEILPELDIIVLTIALTPATENMIARNEINLMKDESVLVNVARGGLINESELVFSLENKKFSGVALDVFEEEPLNNSPLWDLKNVIVTPHNSFVSEKNNLKLYKVILDNLSQLID